MRVHLTRPYVDATVGVSPPISLMYLSAYLKRNEIDATLSDSCVDRDHIGSLTPENPRVQTFLKRIREHRPDLIGMTLFSRELNDIAKLCRILKTTFPAAVIVLGGPHPTALPKETLERIADCDIVVRGEGEVVLYELVRTLQQNRALETVRGISFRSERGIIHHTPDGDIITDLDSLPFPDREGLLQHYRNKIYSSFVYGSPSDVLMTSRGCPYQCSFCFKVCVKYRPRSPEGVLREVDWIVRRIKPVSIQFMDDSFTIDRRRAEAILDGLIERRYPVKIKVRSRVDAVDEPLLRKMKRAGVDTVVYGLESGSQTMLDAFHKKTSVTQNVDACRMTREAGLNCLGDMLLFYPGETRATLKETKRFLRVANPTAVKFNVLTPLPQTKVYDEAKANGTLIGDWGDCEANPWIKLAEFDGIAEMQSIAKKMYLKSLLRPSRAIDIMRVYGGAMLSNPALTVRLVSASVRKKMKY